MKQYGDYPMGTYLEYPELHDQKALSKRLDYVLKSKSDPKMFVDKPSMSYLKGAVTHTESLDSARRFNGHYLLITHWEWERQYEAVAT